ncbi:hypothetical protein J6590_051472 [Homalodisca vitripennis]|nr:hypothetical protein J6590_051472 [Homalodisca vitripennis]
MAVCMTMTISDFTHFKRLTDWYRWTDRFVDPVIHQSVLDFTPYSLTEQVILRNMREAWRNMLVTKHSLCPKTRSTSLQKVTSGGRNPANVERQVRGPNFHKILPGCANSAEDKLLYSESILANTNC